MAVHEKFGHEINRRITESWTREDNYRVKVSTWHDKRHKGYISTISECIIEKGNGYTMERWVMYSDLNKMIQMQAVSRYNYEKMAEAHLQAVAKIIDQVNDLIANRKAEAVA